MGRNNRGQATILIAIIFQILFMFFAMIINVGLLVHDKINLQNSADIAAYYGAMKQAEVLNAMAHTNYEIRQAWKLFVWRLWVVGDAGRNVDLNVSPNTLSSAPDLAAYPNTSNHAYPILCVANPLWQEIIDKGAAAGGKYENLCDNPDLNIPAITPLPLTGLQLLPIFSAILGTFAIQSSANASAYLADFKNVSPLNYTMATIFLGSYKAAAAQRRAAMRRLQNLLIQSSSDFTDLSGNSVSATVRNTLLKNLTAANRNGLNTFQFTNSLSGHPFIVPIDVRSMVRYEDYVSGSATTGVVRNVGDTTAPWTTGGSNPTFTNGQSYWVQDYDTAIGAETAAAFVQEPDNFSQNQYATRSLVGFEKNPWTLAYVSVVATTHPKMLFSPFSAGTNTITLTAESYAMPFGGKMGPWYGTGWPSSSDLSNGTNVDALLPPRIGGGSGTVDFATMPPPNYSRFPNDTVGMNSRMARAIGISGLTSGHPSYFRDYTPLVLNPGQVSDPIAGNTSLPLSSVGAPTTKIRNVETAAVAPDLFDAIYYSVSYDILNHFQDAPNWFGSSASDNSACHGQCFDLGNLVGTSSAGSFGINDQLKAVVSAGFDAIPYWVLSSPFHLNTSWSQGDPGHYDGTQAALTVGKDWSQVNADGVTPGGGRAGYSVKIVSKQFLKSSLPLGGTSGSGQITNPPQ